MLRASISISTVLILLLGQPSAAQTAPIPEVGDLYGNLQRDLNDPDQQREVVAVVGRYCAALQQRYPTNSPAEDQWLEREMGGGGERLIRALASAEFGRRDAAMFTANCISMTEAFEMYPDARPNILFALIGSIARYSPDAEYHAESNGLDGDAWGFTFLGTTIRLLSDIGMAILNQRLADQQN